MVIKKILVTGGAGFIGHHSVNTLLLEGYKVHVLDDLSTGKIENLPRNPHLTFQEGSTLNLKNLQEAFVDVDAVLHLAALVSVPASLENPQESLRRNIVGFVNVLETARKLPNKPRVIYASSAAVYGAMADICSEDSASNLPLSPYGLEKQVNEMYGEMYTRLYDLPTLGLRYFNVFGTGQDPASPYSGVISKFATMVHEERPIEIHGDGRQSRDFIHVRDVAHANYLALLSNHTGLINIASGESITINRLVDIIEEILEKKVAKRPAPARKGDIQQSRANIARARAMLKFSAQTGLEQGLGTLLARL